MNFLQKTLRSITDNPRRVAILILEGVLIGIFAGLIVCLYRFLLTESESTLQGILSAIKGDIYLIIGWFVILVILGLVTGRLLRWEPFATGSGIPQVTAEIKGYFSPKWWKIIISKTIGGTLSTLAGLSLGREGPSIQLGGMAGKGISKLFKGSKTDEFRSIITGASAGLSATFNAPLSGVVFSLEEITHNFDKSIIFVGLTAAIVADVISKYFFGLSTIFRFPSSNFPLKYFWLFIILGIILGFSGYFYNKTMVAGFDFSSKATNIPIEVKLVVTFLIVGVVSLFIPQILGGGHLMVDTLYVAIPPLSVIIILLIAKYLLGIISFSSGAPGGIFFPLLVIGAYIGAAFGSFFVPIFGLHEYCVYKFIIIAMAGFFTATVRTPITAVVLVSEMTGTTENIVATLIVCIIAYIIPTLLNNKPIYESIFTRLLKSNKISQETTKGRHILKDYVVPLNSYLIDKKIEEIPLSNNSIIVSVLREENYIIARADLKIKFADHIYILIDQEHYTFENKEIVTLINKKNK